MALPLQIFEINFEKRKCHLFTICVGAQGNGQIYHPVETPPFSLEGEHEIKNAIFHLLNIILQTSNKSLLLFVLVRNISFYIPILQSYLSNIFVDVAATESEDEWSIHKLNVNSKSNSKSIMNTFNRHFLGTSYSRKRQVYSNVLYKVDR